MAKKSGNSGGNKSSGSSPKKQGNSTSKNPKVETFSTTNRGGTTPVKKGK